MTIAVMSAVVINVHAQTFGSLQAVDDYAVTGPLQPVKVDVLLNDRLPCPDSYEWDIVSVSPAGMGVATKSGAKMVFSPAAHCRNTNVEVTYYLKCATGAAVTAIAHISVTEFNFPANQIPAQTECADPMLGSVDFQVREKFHTSTNYRLDGFSMPLVGDINGDGKPEIVALGLYDASDGGSVDGYGRYIYIFDGQLGNLLWSINTGTGAPSNNTANKETTFSNSANNSSNQFRLRQNGYNTHSSPGHLAIADMDGDGKAEIVVVETGSNGRIYALTPTLDAQRRITGFSVLWDKSGSDGYKSDFSGTKNHTVYGAGIPYIADINGDGVPEVIVYNKIYDGLTGEKVCTLQTLNTFSTHPTSSQVSTYQNNYAYVGRQPVMPRGDQYAPCMAIADINGDGILDIIAGSKVYIMKNGPNGKPALDYIINGPSQVTVRTGTGNATTTQYLSDGFTAVCDIDMDGKLEVIVISVTGTSNSDNQFFMVYVWDPINNPTQAKAAMQLFEDGWEGNNCSYPFIGDINGKKDSYDGTKQMPEFCFVTSRLYTNGSNNTTMVKPHPSSVNSTGLSKDPTYGFVNNQYFSNNSAWDIVHGFILGFTWHAEPNGSTPIEERLKMSWAKEIQDRSHVTGITMFDFDNDGAMDICYKDENSVSVISPSRQDYIPYNATTSNNNKAIRFKKNNIYSYTGYEAPVIADVNMDGSADIITMNYPNSGFHSLSYIYVWEHEVGTPKWAPCPPVWNQAIYNPRYIHEDLTVPAKPESMLTSYQLSNKTIYPYNTQWVQQPIVKYGQGFTPILRKPDADLYDMSVVVSNNGRTATVTLHLRNSGSASINANTPVTFYNGGGNPGLAIEQIDQQKAANPALKLKTDIVGLDVFPGESVVLTYTLTNNTNAFFDNKLIWARIMDNGTNFPSIGDDDCDLTNNAFSESACSSMLPYNISVPNNEPILCTHPNGVSEPLTLTVAPSGALTYPVRTYQWYRNDVKLAGETDSTVAVTQDGIYKCYVTEGICRKFSTPITLTKRMVEARNDTVGVMANRLSPLIVVTNDYIPKSCGRPNVTVVTNPTRGAVERVSIDTIYYKTTAANTNYSGLDSLEYSIDGCAPAKVYIFVNNTVALKYAACPGAKVDLSFSTIPGVKYNWYAGKNDNTPLVDANGVSGSNVNSVFISKNNADPQIVWAEPVANNKKLDRIPVYIYMGEDCKSTEQTLSTCAKQGTSLYKEDFGEAPCNTMYPNDYCDNSCKYGTQGPGQGIIPVDPGYIYSCRVGGGNHSEYGIIKKSEARPEYNDIKDRVKPNAGYYIGFDAADQPSQFWKKEINGLCAGTRLYFSAWLVNFVNSVYTNSPYNYKKPNLTFRLEDTSGNLLAIFYTGDLDSEPINTPAPGKWKKYGFSFETPENVSSIVLRIINNNSGSGNGNDFGMDDIEISLCAPEAVIKNYTAVRTVCSGGNLTLDGEYFDDGSFGSGLASRWEFSTTGDNNSWSALPNSTAKTDFDYIQSNQYVISNMDAAKAGYYRFVVADSTNIDNHNCCARSKAMKVELASAPDLYLAMSGTAVNSNGDLIVSVDVHNSGAAAMNPPIHVALYADSTSSGIKLANGVINTAINNNSSANITLTVPNVSQNKFVTAVVRVNDDGTTFPKSSECDTDNNTLAFLNPDVYNWMIKKSSLNNAPHDGGVYSNPVSVLYGDVIEYEITAVNANLKAGNIIITDTLPAYLEYQASSAQPTPDAISPDVTAGTPARKILKWTMAGVSSKDTRTVRFKATPESGAVASQPLFANQATVTVSDTLVIKTNSVYHQGAGISIVTFSAGLGGVIINASPQAVDYKTTARSGVLVVPDSGYRFAGWSHDGYVSMRNAAIAPQENVMLYDTLTVYGNVELRAVFTPDTKSDNFFNEKIDEMDSDEKVWSYGSEVHVRTVKPGSVIRVYALDGALLRQQTALSVGETLIKLPHGVYVVTVNNGIGHKVAVSD